MTHPPDRTTEESHGTGETRTGRNATLLAGLFPGCVTETRDPDGSVRIAIDLDRLRTELGEHLVDGAMLAAWGSAFSYLKPVFLIEFLIRTFSAPHDDALILDFFAGSGTTAHAVSGRTRPTAATAGS
ncbi:DNA methyltransferase [Catenuloplanes indicus]|uniref:DNA methylase N-4/N-6 domain-containing protein n=1 Tax=Catenuloplanes indicus TaxID=137267 RepID=A0AAE3VZ89_9ACTN|nr:DNA methyltransferase [Catenuloplanes indicus]MDQ0366440.1 hypothetical protein [Catenuloplanes indicus]